MTTAGGAWICEVTDDGSGLVQVSNMSSGGASGGISGDGSTVIWGPDGFGMNTLYRSNSDGSGTTALLTLNRAYVLPRHCITNDGSLACSDPTTCRHCRSYTGRLTRNRQRPYHARQGNAVAARVAAFSISGRP